MGPRVAGTREDSGSPLGREMVPQVPLVFFGAVTAVLGKGGLPMTCMPQDLMTQ